MRTFLPTPFPQKGAMMIQPHVRLSMNMTLPPWGGPAEAV